MIAIQVNDREELEPTMVGDYELVDSESNGLQTVQMTADVIARYKQQVTEHYGHLHALCKASRRAHVSAVTDTPFEDLIFDVFRKAGFLR